jgi:hypothetical protein
MKMTWLIGLMCKRSDTFSRQILIGRGLNHFTSAMVLIQIRLIASSFERTYQMSDIRSQKSEKNRPNGLVFSILASGLRFLASEIVW